MLYFISSEAGIKIGISDSILSRLAKINNTSPYPCKVVLTLEVPNQKQTERQLHEALAAYRKNGEWFEVSFAKAFQALVELNVISDPFPKLDLLYPEQVIPEMDSEFPEWWIAVNDLDPCQVYTTDVNRAWKEGWKTFQKYREQNLPLSEMIALGKSEQMQIQEEFSKLVKKLRKEEF